MLKRVQHDEFGIDVRPLTPGERALAASMFGDAIDYDAVTIRRRKWFPLQPRGTAMAPCGHIHFHPLSYQWSPDFSADRVALQGLFLHEMTHVWQTQTCGRLYLPLMRHPFCRYDYALNPDRPFERYGLEQQAEIVRHAFHLARGECISDSPPLGDYREVLPFAPWRS